jgi:MFS family permease
MLGSSLLQPILSIYAKELGASALNVGFIVSGYWITRFIMEIPAGFLSGRFGYYRPLVIGLFISTVGCFLSALAVDPLTLMLSRAITGIGAPLFFGVSMTLVVDIFDERTRGSAMGVFQGIEFAGSILGSAISGFIVASVGFKATFIVSGLISAISVVLIALPPYIRKISRKRNADAHLLRLSIMAQVLGRRNLLIVSSSIFAEFVMTSGVLYTMYPIFAKERLGLTLQEIGLLMGARSAGFTVSLLFVGYVSDRVGRRLVLLAGLGLTGLLVLILSSMSMVTPIAAIIALIGISTGAIWIVCPVLAAGGIPTQERGPAIGAFRTFMDLGSVFGPILISASQEVFGFNACFYLSSLLLLVNILPAIGIREATRGSRDNER